MAAASVRVVDAAARIMAVCVVIGASVGAERRAVVATKLIALMRPDFVASRRPCGVRFVFLYFVDDDASDSDTQQGSTKVRSSLNL